MTTAISVQGLLRRANAPRLTVQPSRSTVLWFHFYEPATAESEILRASGDLAFVMRAVRKWARKQ